MQLPGFHVEQEDRAVAARRGAACVGEPARVGRPLERESLQPAVADPFRALIDVDDAIRVEVVDPDEPERVVDYGETGRVRLTTLTKEFFMPRFLERDEALRCPPREPYAWDGVAEVRPFGAMEKTIVEGVY